MSNKKLLTVITAVFNGEKTLRDTIESVIQQKDFDLIEYIIIDGASTDGTINIINEYKENISKVISEPDHGIYNAMNKGLDLATGEYVCFINSDDYYIDNKVLSPVLSIIKSVSRERRDVIYGDILLKDNEEYLHKKAKHSKMLFNMSLCHPAVFISRDIHYKFNEDNKISSDYELLLSLFSRKKNFLYLSFPIAVMRLGGISEIYRMQSILESNMARSRLYNKHIALPLNAYSIFRIFITRYIKKVFRVKR